MPHVKSAKKRLKQNEKRRLRNRYFKGLMRSAIKRFRKALSEENLQAAQEMFPNVVKTIDKVATKGVIKKGQASRRISRLAQQLNKLKAKAEGEAN